MINGSFKSQAIGLSEGFFTADETPEPNQDHPANSCFAKDLFLLSYKWTHIFYQQGSYLSKSRKSLNHFKFLKSPTKRRVRSSAFGKLHRDATATECESHEIEKSTSGAAGEGKGVFFRRIRLVPLLEISLAGKGEGAPDMCRYGGGWSTIQDDSIWICVKRKRQQPLAWETE